MHRHAGIVKAPGYGAQPYVTWTAPDGLMVVMVTHAAMALCADCRGPLVAALYQPVLQLREQPQQGQAPQLPQLTPHSQAVIDDALRVAAAFYLEWVCPAGERGLPALLPLLSLSRAAHRSHRRAHARLPLLRRATAC